MDDADLGEIEVISDGEGLALIGPQSAVDLFLSTNRLESRDLGLPRLSTAFGAGSAVAKAGSEVAANSGRWMKLTEESWAAAQKLPKISNSSSNQWHATLRAPNGQFAKNLQFLKTPGAMLTNPAMLAGAAGLMAQIAMQQTMDEITDYLKVIDEKVDDVLRAQKDAVLADMIGVDMVLEEAMTIRKEVGRISDVTWSKVQGTSMAIARTQAYALRQLDALAEKLESKSVNELADVSPKVERQTLEWLAVLAHCFYLHEATGVVELDRVLDSSPDELDRHRIALRAARSNRVALITTTTRRLLDRMDSAASLANAKVLFNPIESPAIVRSRNQIANSVGGLHNRIGIEAGADALEARRWSKAATETRDDVIKAGAQGAEAAMRLGAGGVDAAARLGAEGAERAKILAGSMAVFAERALKRRRQKNDDSSATDGGDRPELT